MKPFLLRMSAYLLLSLGLALAVSPWLWPDRRWQLPPPSEVNLRLLATTAQAVTGACPAPPLSLDPSHLERSPALAQALRHLQRGSDCLSLRLRRLPRSLRRKQGEVLCLSWQGDTFRLVFGRLWTGYGASALLYRVGVAPERAAQAPAGDPRRLREFPRLAACIQRLRRQLARSLSGHPPQCRAPLASWQSWTGGEAGQVRLGSYLVQAEVAPPQRVLVEVPGLRTVRLVLGGVLVLAGLWLLRGLYRPGPGFVAMPRRWALTADLLYGLTGAMGAFGLCQYLLAQWLEVEPPLPLVTLEAVALFYLPGLAVLAAFASQWSGQSLEVDPRGLTRHRPGSRRFIPWEEVQGFTLQDRRIPVIRGEAVLSRSISRDLVIQTKEGSETFFEPQVSATKQELVSALRRLAPPRLQADIARLAAEWKVDGTGRAGEDPGEGE